MSRLQLNPPVATVYPNQRQLFIAKATPPPAMWHTVTDSGDIKSDFSLEVDGAGASVTGQGAHWLQSGIGAIEFTIDDQCRPTSTGSFVFSGLINDISGAFYAYTVEIKATTLKAFNESASEIFSASYSTVSGDVYKLELNAGFSLYRNNVLLHSRVGLATAVGYPMRYNAGIFEPTATAPTRIPAPRLIGGGWRVAPVVAFTTPSHGNLDYTGVTDRVEYFGGITPGRYALVAQIEAAADAGNVQRATATIEIPALQILGPSELTLQPSRKIRPKTNYPDDLVAWSIVSGGGSFTQGEFTAPALPGPVVIRATADVNDQIADIAITVEAVITNPSNYFAAKASEQIDFGTNIAASVIPAIVSGGSVVAGTGAIEPGLPLGGKPGDAMILLVRSANETVTPPAGFDPIDNSPQGIGTPAAGGAVRLSAFYSRWAANHPRTIPDVGDHAIAQILLFRGCPLTGFIWNETAGDAVAATTAVSIPGLTTTVPDCLILDVVAHATDTPTPQVSGYANGSLVNLTERADNSTTQGVGGGFAATTGGKAAQGSVSATTATLATSSAQARMKIALKPGTLIWTASIGSIDASTGVWTAPSLPGQTAKIMVTNGLFTATIEIMVLEVFPFSDFSLPVSWDRNLNALVSMSEDRSSRITREKSSPFDSYPIRFLSRTLAEAATVSGEGGFYDQHGLGKPFILEDKVRGIRKVGWFDSKIAHEARDECDIDLSFQFLEARL